MFHHHIGPPTASLRWATSRYQILCWFDGPMYSFEDCDLIFCWISLKCLFAPPKTNFGFLAVCIPLNVIGRHRDPKRHILGQNHAYMAILVEIRHAVRPGREPKKPTKARKETYSDKLGVHSDHSRWRSDMVLRAGRSLGDSSTFQVSSKSVEQFSRCGGRNSSFPITLASGLYKSLSWFHWYSLRCGTAEWCRRSPTDFPPQ